MIDGFSEKRKPDYLLTVHVTGTRLGSTGKTSWQVEAEGPDADDSKKAAEILRKAIEVLDGA